MFNCKDKIIFIDIDDTLADTRAAVHAIYTGATGKPAGDIRTKSKAYVDFCPEWTDEEVERLFLKSNYLYEVAKPIAGSEKAIKELIKKGYDVRIATLHSPYGVSAKQKWIETYFPELKDSVYYIHWRVPNKDIFKEYGLVDDDLKNIKTNKSATPILLDVYDIYSNTEFNGIKCKTWNEVLRHF